MQLKPDSKIQFKAISDPEELEQSKGASIDELQELPITAFIHLIGEISAIRGLTAQKVFDLTFQLLFESADDETPLAKFDRKLAETISQLGTDEQDIDQLLGMCFFETPITNYLPTTHLVLVERAQIRSQIMQLQEKGQWPPNLDEVAVEPPLSNHPELLAQDIKSAAE